MKKTPSASTHGMRSTQSLSSKFYSLFIFLSQAVCQIDTISLQKKSALSADRLKRLESSELLFQRQTSLITKKMTSITSKLSNPFGIAKKKIVPTTIVDSSIDSHANTKRQVTLVENNNNTTTKPRRTVTINPLKRTREDDDEGEEHQNVQILSVNSQIRRPTGLFSYEEASKHNGKEKFNIPTF